MFFIIRGPPICERGSIFQLDCAAFYHPRFGDDTSSKCLLVPFSLVSSPRRWGLRKVCKTSGGTKAVRFFSFAPFLSVSFFARPVVCRVHQDCIGKSSSILHSSFFSFSLCPPSPDFFEPPDPSYWIFLLTRSPWASGFIFFSSACTFSKCFSRHPRHSPVLFFFPNEYNIGYFSRHSLHFSPEMSTSTSPSFLRNTFPWWTVAPPPPSSPSGAPCQ